MTALKWLDSNFGQQKLAGSREMRSSGPKKSKKCLYDLEKNISKSISDQNFFEFEGHVTLYFQSSGSISILMVMSKLRNSNF